MLLALVGGAVAVADPDESTPAKKGSQAASGSVGPPAGSSGNAAAVVASSQGACGAASTQTAADVYAKVARRIYEGEVHSTEVRADVAHITNSQELLSALARSNAQAVHRAVYSIVYTPHWHIVRLRVTQNGRVLADVGGPYIIAPISGPLTVNGKKVGTYTMSVQDDVGYVKLVSRFIGVPIDLYGTPRPPGAFLMGTLKPAPAAVGDGTVVKVGGGTYLTRVHERERLSGRQTQGSPVGAGSDSIRIRTKLSSGTAGRLGQCRQARGLPFHSARHALPGVRRHAAGLDRKPCIRQDRQPSDRRPQRRPAPHSPPRHGQVPRRSPGTSSPGRPTRRRGSIS